MSSILGFLTIGSVSTPKLLKYINVMCDVLLQGVEPESADISEDEYVRSLRSRGLPVGESQTAGRGLTLDLYPRTL